MAIRTAAGTIIGISASAPATFDETGYDAVAFTKIGRVEMIDGELGRIYQLVEFQELESRATTKLKGTFNEGSLTVQVALEESDAGQIICEAAAVSDDDYYFEIVYPSGKKRWFPAKVMGFRERGGGGNDVQRASIPLELTTAAGNAGIVKSA